MMEWRICDRRVEFCVTEEVAFYWGVWIICSVGMGRCFDAMRFLRKGNAVRCFYR